MSQNGYGLKFSKMEPNTEMALQVDSSNYFHPESTKIDGKLYDDPIHIITTSIIVILFI
jgi:hypothetical protein